MPVIYNTEKGTGFVPDTADSRDKEYDHVALGFSPFDWEKGFDIEEELGVKIETEDQNGSLSCVGQATAKYAYVLNSLELKPIYGSMQFAKLSAKSIYSQIHLPKGTAHIRDAFKLLKSYGANEENDVPSYENGKPPSEKFMQEDSWKTASKTKKAKNYQVSEYRMIVDKKDIDLVAQAIRDNHGVVMGFDGENNGTWHSEFPKPPKKAVWGHAIYGGKAKLINGKKYIGFKNSWGDVGVDGWQWFGEEWFIGGYASNIWTLVDKANVQRVKLLDKDGKPRYISTKFAQVIRALTKKRGYKIVNI